MPSRKPQIAVVATRGLADLCRSQLTEYAHLADWHASVPERHRPFVERLAALFGRPLPAAAP